MAADNWRACPGCAEKKRRGAKKAQEKARRSYGKVSAEKYEQLLEAAKKQTDEVENLEFAEKAHTFREDYEIRTDIDGTFTVDYTGSCTSCGYRVNYKHEMFVDPEAS